jgi:hypothetical protein
MAFFATHLASSDRMLRLLANLLVCPRSRPALSRVASRGTTPACQRSRRQAPAPRSSPDSVCPATWPSRLEASMCGPALVQRDVMTAAPSLAAELLDREEHGRCAGARAQEAPAADPGAASGGRGPLVRPPLHLDDARVGRARHQLAVRDRLELDRQPRRNLGSALRVHEEGYPGRRRATERRPANTSPPPRSP